MLCSINYDDVNECILCTVSTLHIFVKNTFALTGLLAHNLRSCCRYFHCWIIGRARQELDLEVGYGENYYALYSHIMISSILIQVQVKVVCNIISLMNI